MRRAVVFPAILAALALAGSAQAATVTVTVGPSLSYTPQNQTIGVGDTVHWNWAASNTLPHTTTSGVCSPTCTPDGNWDSGTPQTSGSYDQTFNAAGVYHYYCTLHKAAMTGTITVVSPSDSPPTARFTLSPATPTVGQTVTFDASSSSDTDGDTVASYVWSFDGGVAQTTPSATITHSFSTVGAHSATLTVYDNRGSKSAPVTHTVNVSAAAPTPPPKIASAKVKPSSFCAKKSAKCKHPGTKLAFTLNEGAQVRIVVMKKGTTKVIRSQNASARAGKNSLAFGKRLKVGRYVATLTATSGGKTSSPVTVKFRVRKS